jgi:ABC-type Mn2+/Zn2+ transport system ATPase subunit
MIRALDLNIFDRNKNKLCGPLNFNIHENVITLIQGANGSGKSTFLKFLSERKDLHTGLIELKNSDYNFSYLPQFYTNDYQSPATLDDILKAFKVKTKYLSENLSPYLIWGTCSGGEKQRILLDIVLNRKADILLLDEPTNSLDEISKHLLWNSLKTLLNSKAFRTIVVVSHENPSISEIEKINLK